jgi:peptidyl-prolyl cis-trans isomerase SurA
MNRLIYIGLAAAVAAALPANAQVQTLPLDRVVGVVGSQAITWYELQERINVARQEGAQLPTDSAAFVAFARDILNDMVDEEVLVQKADEMKITIPDIDLQNSVEQQLRQVRGQFRTDQEFRAQLAQAGMGTPDEFRRFLTERIKRNQLLQRTVDSLRRAGRLVPTTVSDEDVRAEFDRNRASFGPRPSTVTFRQIIVPTLPSAAAKEVARVRAESLLAEIRRGGDFESIARRESMDATRDVGGDLGWARRGVMVPEFERWLFPPYGLAPGQLSPVVETPFGYHIIRVDRVQPAEVKSRHILIRPAIDQADIARAGALADSVAALWRRGAPFDSLARAHHDFANREETTILTPFPRPELPESYRNALENARPNDIVRFTLPASNEVPKHVALQLLTEQEGGEHRFEDLRDRIRQSLAEGGAYRRLIDDLRKQTYVSIRL